ncbi:MAG: hypothetical protein RLY20_3223 [Verrucomicrobiota bacterium]
MAGLGGARIRHCITSLNCGELSEDDMSETISVSGLSNAEFLEHYAAPGRIGLSGGTTLIDKAICRAERHLDAHHRWGVWSHAFIFQGRRVDGHQWVIESDLQIQRKHIQLGVQENRVAKYHDEQLYSSLAVLDLGLTPAQTDELLREALELVASRERYSLRELIGTLLALKHSELRGRENMLARDRSVFCSAFVRHVFGRIDLNLAPGVDLKNTTPEDIANTVVPHTAYVLKREVARSRLDEMGRRVKLRVKARIRQVKRRIA